MSSPSPFSDTIPLALAHFDPAPRSRLLQPLLIRRWADIFGALSHDISFVSLHAGALVVFSHNSAAADFAKFAAPVFISKINSLFGAAFVTSIEFSKVPAPRPAAPAADAAPRYAHTATPTAAPAATPKASPAASTAATPNPAAELHRCFFCNALISSPSSLCDFCTLVERDRLRSTIRRIFHDVPWTPFRAVQEKIVAEFPHLARECTLDTIESARMDLIAQTAARVSYGDTTSDAAKFLVMLVRQLPREKLTPAIISRTLKEFHFNLADLPPFDEYKFKKMPRRSSRKIKKCPL